MDTTVEEIVVINNYENDSETILLCESVNSVPLPTFLLRKQIQRVNRSTSLSLAEKNKRIQDLMKGKLRQCSSLTCCGGNGRVIDYVNEEKEAVDDDHPTQTERRARLIKQEDQTYNWCKHYEKGNSRFYFACCGVIDPCHRCHMERGCDVKPPMITSICCNQCDVNQPPSAKCINCNVIFSTTYCEKCMLWTNKEVFHCDQCETCRVGKAEEIFHCDTCAACYRIQHPHVCTAISPLKFQTCAICCIDVHLSQDTVQLLRCGHAGHLACFEALFKDHSDDIPKCPICLKTVLNPEQMEKASNAYRRSIAQQPMRSLATEVRVGEQFSTRYGQFLVERKEQIITSATDPRLTREQFLLLSMLGQGQGQGQPSPHVIHVNMTPSAGMTQPQPQPQHAQQALSFSCQPRPLLLPSAPAGVVLAPAIPSWPQLQPYNNQPMVNFQHQHQHQGSRHQHQHQGSQHQHQGSHHQHQHQGSHHQHQHQTLPHHTGLVFVYAQTMDVTPYVQTMGVTPTPLTPPTPAPPNIIRSRYFSFDNASNFLYHGRLINWTLANGKTAQATFRHEELSSVDHVIIFCNECEQRSSAPYHYLGMECQHCHGFNTVRL